MKQHLPRSFPRLSALLPLVLVFFACACSEGAALPGDVATVNGRGISLQDLESRRGVLFSGFSPTSASLEDAALYEQYRYVLGKMIEEAVICQYMEGKGLKPDPALLEAEEKRVREDYPPGAFEEQLEEQGLTLTRWRKDVYRRLVVEHFIGQVLRPEISISPEEVQLYYREHSEEFTLPEQWHFLQIMGPDKRDVELAGKSLLAGREPSAAQKEFLVVIHDIRMAVDLLPEELLKQLSPLQPLQASKITGREGEYRVLVLLEKVPASVLDALEISRRIEQTLAEEKMRATYTAWMNKRLPKQDIRISPSLLAAPQEAEDTRP